MSQNNTRKQHTRKELNSIIDKKDEQINQLKEEIKGLNCKIDKLRDNIIKLTSKTEEEKTFDKIVEGLHNEIEGLQEVILFYQEQEEKINKLEREVSVGSKIIKQNIKNMEGLHVINITENIETYTRINNILYMQLDCIFRCVTNIFYWPVKKKSDMKIDDYIIFLDPPNSAEYKFRIWGVEKNINPETIDLGEWYMVCTIVPENVFQK